MWAVVAGATVSLQENATAAASVASNSNVAARGAVDNPTKDEVMLLTGGRVSTVKIRVSWTTLPVPHRVAFRSH